MTASSRDWVWVFGDIAGLRWVLDRSTMAFPDSAAPRLRAMSAGDRAVLYVTRGAFHNPSRDVARLAGLVTVAGTPTRRRSVTSAGREFIWQAPITVEVALPERVGPPVHPLVDRLSFVHNRSAWGQYFRKSPKLLTTRDFAVLAGAVRAFARELSST